MPTWNSEMGETSTVDFHCCTMHLDIIKVFFIFHQWMHYIFA